MNKILYDYRKRLYTKTTHDKNKTESTDVWNYTAISQQPKTLLVRGMLSLCAIYK